MDHPMFADIPAEDIHLLVPEAGACFDFPEGGCRMVLAVGLGLDPDTQEPSLRHGLPLREETLAMLWACLLTRTYCEPRPGSPLHHLRCHWGYPGGPGDEAEHGGQGDGLGPILRPLDRLCLLTPEGASAFAVGDNADDAVWYVGLVGRDEASGERRAYLLREDWLGQLWQTLLLGAGSYFAAPGSPYQALFEAER
jgi:hypothetical protein